MKQPIRTKPMPYCPDCGAKMKLRWPGKYQHFDPFWGCMQYPDCRGRRNVLPNGEPEGDEEFREDEYWEKEARDER